MTAAPVFDTTIRYLESAAVDMRRHGLLPYELQRRQRDERAARLARLHSGSLGGAGNDLLNRDAGGLTADYVALAKEVLAGIAAAERSVQLLA